MDKLKLMRLAETSDEDAYEQHTGDYTKTERANLDLSYPESQGQCQEDGQFRMVSKLFNNPFHKAINLFVLKITL